MVTGLVAAVARAPPPAKTTTGDHPSLGCRWIPGTGAMPAGELGAVAVERSPPSRPVGDQDAGSVAAKPSQKGVLLTFDFEWAELPDDIAHRKHQAWQEWEATDERLQDPTHPTAPDEQAELEQRHRAAWKQYWHADGARYHLSNRQVGDAITVMERSGMARRVPTPAFPTPADHGASSAEYDDWLDASDRGQPTQPSAELAGYLDALDRHQRANYDAHVIPVHKLWTNDGWLLTPDELAAALPHAPASATDRRQRPIPWWAQWLDYLDTARGHGGVRVH
jgi:hypothetical protein